MRHMANGRGQNNSKIAADKDIKFEAIAGICCV